MLLETEVPQALRGNVRGTEVKTGIPAWPRPKENTALRYASAVGPVMIEEGAAKATRPAEGEGGDVFSLFR